MACPTESFIDRLARHDATMQAELVELLANPFLALRAVATGDLEAQRKLALAAWVGAIIQDEDMVFAAEGDEMVEAALIFSRMAAAQGTVEDVRLLAVRLATASQISQDLETERMGEAIGWLLWGEDAGLGETSASLSALVESASPVAIERGREFHAHMLASLGTERTTH